MTQTMTIKEFMGRQDRITEKEMEQYKSLVMALKAAGIVAVALLPLHLGSVFSLSNLAVEAYQFSPRALIEIVEVLK